ncbi:hypothetical protein B566_EDAN018126 [Ephemera danica]|nr:hypothetical protein B566_EDAN018126 [Ephemera danica]
MERGEYNIFFPTPAPPRALSNPGTLSLWMKSQNIGKRGARNWGEKEKKVKRARKRYGYAKTSGRGGATGSKLGESCSYDDDCDVTYSFCRAQQTCECKRGFEPGPTRDRCMATVGAICTTHYDCTGLPNSECDQEVCSCRNGYVPHPTMKECLQGLDGLCTNSEECHVSDTDPTKNEQVECVAGRCQCKMGYHIATDGVTCTDGAAQLTSLSLLMVTALYIFTRMLH